MSRWLVTGGAGFIGSHIVEQLLQKKQYVRVLDNFCTGSRDFIKSVRGKIDFIEGDIRNPKTAQKAVKGIHYVLHQAALRSVPRSLEDPLSSNEVNVSGTLNMLLAASNAGVKRFVAASSSSVYGDLKKWPQKECYPQSPISPYAVSKAAGEIYCRMFYKTYGLQTVSLRYFNVFGPRQNPKSKYAAVIPLFILAALKDKSCDVHGDGKQSRDFTYVDNVVQANILSATRGPGAGNVYNVAVGECHSLLDILRITEDYLGCKIRKNFTPARKGDVRKTHASILAIKKDVGYAPRWDFQRGMIETIKYFQNNY
ncbi:MAG TPA: SDR family oxidoreductase [Elusimicrobiota bacterium]|nr:SDR family oxidoreductase [Elusimicrobiota bacterium]